MSELCEAQETRGSKFIYEFGRNSTVYCFVASGLLYSSIKKSSRTIWSPRRRRWRSGWDLNPRVIAHTMDFESMPL